LGPTGFSYVPTVQQSTVRNFLCHSSRGLDDLEDRYLAEPSLIDIRAGKVQPVLLEQVMKRYGVEGSACPAAERELDNLDPQVARRILALLHDRIAILADPRSLGEALKGSRLVDFWTYRVGDDRVIASIDDGAMRILVGRVGNRNAVYRRCTMRGRCPNVASGRGTGKRSYDS
jgi:mRNA interferase RelE/StbE